MGRPTTYPIHTAQAVSAPWHLDVGMEPPLGAHLVTPRHGYSHHGIYVGHGNVVHYAGLAEALRRGPVEEVSIERFAAGYQVSIKPSPQPAYGENEAVQRARSRLGENRYRLLTNNCEHFCAWCLYGVSRSQQVRACFIDPRAALQTAICLLTAILSAALQLRHIGSSVA
ncbi:lecithin retinol acyltransferase family protein [Cupriavidus sp. CuC1]|uniref:lecithin retinol acyltransferase family protein n=1 Tax=Cupriavidus sp. CuC1 TaxID=3373131 RepID=UPI0037CF2AF3